MLPVLKRAKRKVTIFSIVVGVVIGMASSVASAATITQTFSYGPAYTDWSNGYVFNQFNTAFGTLNSVTVQPSGVLNTMGATFTDNSIQAETLTSFQETFLAGLTGPSATNLTSSTALPGMGPVILGPLGSGNNSASQSVSNVAFNLGSDTYYTSLNAYEGLGSVTFTGTAQASDSFFGDSNIDWTATTQATETVTLVYDYSPTSAPEPVSAVLSGSGLALLAVWRRKRLARAGNPR